MREQFDVNHKWNTYVINTIDIIICPYVIDVKSDLYVVLIELYAISNV